MFLPDSNILQYKVVPPTKSGQPEEQKAGSKLLLTRPHLYYVPRLIYAMTPFATRQETTATATKRRRMNVDTM